MDSVLPFSPLVYYNTDMTIQTDAKTLSSAIAVLPSGADIPRRPRLGILGGTFHPIHLGHLEMALSALKMLALDKVLLMVDRIPPHKELAEGAADSQRLEMVKLAAAPHPGLEASDFELMREGTSYTALTLTLLQERFPEEDLFFIMGSDMLRTLHTWYHPEIICAKAKLVCICRQGEEGGEQEAAERLQKAYGAEVILLPPVREVSSTLIRKRTAQGLPIGHLVPPSVAEYICVHGLYAPDPIPALTAAMEQHLKPGRFAHTVGVMLTAMEMAEHLGIDGEKARLGALLHDCAKSLSVEEQYALAARARGQLMPTDIVPIVHAPAGSVLSREVYGIEDEEVLQAICLHTTGESRMTPLDKLLFLADMVEPGRSFKGVETLRQKALCARSQKELDSALLLAIRHNICYIKEKGERLHPASLRALKTLEQEIQSN